MYAIDSMSQNWGWIVAVLAIGGVALKFIRWTAIVDADRNQFREFMREIRDEMREMRGEMREMRGEIKNIFNRLPGEPVEKVTSPISLTDYGKELSQSINASEIADLQITKVTAAVENFNAYQIQEYCFSFSKDDLLNELKANHADLYDKIHEVAFEQGMDVEKLTRVIALELRDKILPTLNKPHAEIDQHSPNKP